MAKPMLICYACVSTVDQNLGLQRDAFTEAGCQRFFTEQMSGAVTDRPALRYATAQPAPPGERPARISSTIWRRNSGG